MSDRVSVNHCVWLKLEELFQHSDTIKAGFILNFIFKRRDHHIIAYWKNGNWVANVSIAKLL